LTLGAEDSSIYVYMYRVWLRGNSRRKKIYNTRMNKHVHTYMPTLMKSRDISSPDIGPGISNPGFRGNQQLNYQLRHGGCIKAWYSLRGVNGSSTAGYHGILSLIQPPWRNW